MRRLTRAKAIRATCIDCSNYQYKEVRLCTVTDCPLWPYRFGRGYEEPPEKGIGTRAGIDTDAKTR